MTNPGSSAAKRLGCTCPTLDNRYGEGAVLDGQVDPGQFFISPDCPIHADSRSVILGDNDSEGSDASEDHAGDSQSADNDSQTTERSS